MSQVSSWVPWHLESSCALRTPKLMFNIHLSKFATVTETSEALRKSIEDHGWKPCITRDITDSIRDAGLAFQGNVHLVELCNPEYAKKVLTAHPEFSSIMPCQWGIYKGKDGNIYIGNAQHPVYGSVIWRRSGKTTGTKRRYRRKLDARRDRGARLILQRFSAPLFCNF